MARKTATKEIMTERQLTSVHMMRLSSELQNCGTREQLLAVLEQGTKKLKKEMGFRGEELS